jgi:hypothetical protein
MTQGPGANPELDQPYSVTLILQRPVLANERQNMIAGCKRPIVAGRYQSQSHVESARPGDDTFDQLPVLTRAVPWSPPGRARRNAAPALIAAAGNKAGMRFHPLAAGSHVAV